MLCLDPQLCCPAATKLSSDEAISHLVRVMLEAIKPPAIMAETNCDSLLPDLPRRLRLHPDEAMNSPTRDPIPAKWQSAYFLLDPISNLKFDSSEA